MNRHFLAETLAQGVKRAALTPYSTWQELLVTKESLSQNFSTEDGEISAYEIIAVQDHQSFGDCSIELRVLASNGDQQLTAYLDSKPYGWDKTT